MILLLRNIPFVFIELSMGRRHETKKCFPTKCRECGAKVLYWESTKGAKVFLNLPIYGRPQRHICKPQISKKTLVKESHIDHLKKKLNKQITYQCPVCAKIFNVEASLNKHIKDLKNIDEKHAQFFEQIFDLLVWETKKEDPSSKSHLSPFQTKHSLSSMNDRFLFKSKNPKDQDKYKHLIRRKKSRN